MKAQPFGGECSSAVGSSQAAAGQQSQIAVAVSLFLQAHVGNLFD